MALQLLALQLLLPLGLIAWLALGPAASRAGIMAQVGATATVLVAIALAGIWLFPPWWAPYLYGALLLAALVHVVRRRGRSIGAFPSGGRAWAGLAGSLMLGILALAVVVAALLGRRPPDGPVVELGWPLAPGSYLVVNGGSTDAVNAHLVTLDSTVPRYRRWRGNSHALDIVAVDGLGLRAAGLRPADPAAYRIFGARVVAPCAGRVVVAADGMPDLSVPKTDVVNRAGNHVILRCGAADVVLAHLRNGTVAVERGAVVAAGQLLGEVGNSGASDEPHLHIHAQAAGTPEAPMSGEPIPVRIDGGYLVRGSRVRQITRHSDARGTP